MRKIMLAGTALLVLGVAGGGAMISKAGAQPDPATMLLAQNEAPPPGGPGGPGGPPPPPPSGPARPGPGWVRGPIADGPMADGWRRPWHRNNMFGLFFRPDDKQLTAADVQKIAEAFLLWQGNRDWKVTQVTAGPDGKIAFAFATADGGVIARFTMDSKTGRLERIG